MKSPHRAVLLFLLLSGVALSQGPHGEQEGQTRATPPLDVKVHRFDVEDAILRDGLSELSLNNIDGLHLGFEEIIRNRIEDSPKGLSAHFSLHLEGKTVREIIDALCKADTRYLWSQDAASINVYPRAAQDDPSYLLNLRIEHLAVSAIPDPDQALTPLAKLFPKQQIGYFGPGLGDNTYAEPWTANFDHLTVTIYGADGRRILWG